MCCEARVASTHTLRVSIYSNVGVYSICFIAKAVVGQITEQAEVKHPRFSFCSQSIVILVRLGCLRTVIVRMI